MIQWLLVKALTPPYVIDGGAWRLVTGMDISANFHEARRLKSQYRLDQNTYGDRRAVYPGTSLPRRTADSSPITCGYLGRTRSFGESANPNVFHNGLSKSLDLI